jgi:hypothetical protein
MSANSVAEPPLEGTIELTTTCRLCPPDGGTVVARFPGEAPAWRAGRRAAEETERTGLPHHDHYDPQLDAFLVIRHHVPLPLPLPMPRQSDEAS